MPSNVCVIIDLLPSLLSARLSSSKTFNFHSDSKYFEGFQKLIVSLLLFEGCLEVMSWCMIDLIRMIIKSLMGGHLNQKSNTIVIIAQSDPSLRLCLGFFSSETFIQNILWSGSGFGIKNRLKVCSPLNSQTNLLEVVKTPQTSENSMFPWLNLKSTTF